MTDLAALSIAPTDTAKPEKVKGKRTMTVTPKLWAAAAANARKGAAISAARRGVTLWQKCAMVMQPGVWYLSREVWAPIPSAKGVTRSRVSRALRLMAQYGHAVREPLPGYEHESPKPKWYPGANGGGYVIRSPRWRYRITEQGLELAEVGRQRIAEGRPDCLYSGKWSGGRRKGATKANGYRVPKLAGEQGGKPVPASERGAAAK